MKKLLFLALMLSSAAVLAQSNMRVRGTISSLDGDVLSVKTAVARRNFVNSVDESAGTADFLRTFDDYSGSPTQHTNPGWDNVTGLGTPSSGFLSLP